MYVGRVVQICLPSDYGFVSHTIQAFFMPVFGAVGARLVRLWINAPLLEIKESTLYPVGYVTIDYSKNSAVGLNLKGEDDASKLCTDDVTVDTYIDGHELYKI